MLNRHNIKRFIENRCGGKVEVAAKKIEEQLALPEDNKDHLSTDDFSLREIAEGVGIDTSGTECTLSEATTASQFAILVGVLLSRVVMAAYEAAAKVGDKLVTPFPSSLETDTIPGAYLTGDMEDLVEGEEYPHLADIKEKHVTIGHGKRGLILDITEEAVRFDRTGLVMKRANDMGEIMALDRETEILKKVQDATGFKAWNPSGTQADLYQNAQGDGIHDLDNLVTNALTDYTDVQALWELMRLMQNDDGKYINVVPTILLVPIALEIVATRIIKNEVLPGAANIERNPFANKFDIVASPLLDDQSSIIWYLGDFKKQFLEKVVIPLEIKRRRMSDNNEDGWNRDILASFKIRRDQKVGATDYRYVGMSTGAV